MLVKEVSNQICSFTTNLIGTLAVAPRRQGDRARCRIRAVYTTGDAIMAVVDFMDGSMRIHELLELRLFRNPDTMAPLPTLP